MFRLSVTIVSVLSLAACSSAESQSPVDLQPGRYEIHVSGGGPLTGGSATKSLCILPERATSFAESPLQGIVAVSTSGCTADQDRQGNAYAGSYSCSSESAEFGSQQMVLSYEGSLTADSFSINGQLEVTAGQEGGSSSFSIAGKRAGECWS